MIQPGLFKLKRSALLRNPLVQKLHHLDDCIGDSRTRDEAVILNMYPFLSVALIVLWKKKLHLLTDEIFQVYITSPRGIQV